MKPSLVRALAASIPALTQTLACEPPAHTLTFSRASPAAANVASSDETVWGIVPTPRAPAPSPPPTEPSHSEIVDRVVNMASDSNLRARVSARGLSVVNVAWEDTGRAQYSSVGPNISDLSLQVRERSSEYRQSPTSYSWIGGFRSSVLPVIRHPNFTDHTADVRADKFLVRVGNEKGGTLRTVALTEVLKNLHSFLSNPNSLLGSGNLLAPRDTHFLVSAQSVILPIAKNGKVEYNPVLFNYQSSPKNPAVLSILINRQGTSVTVIENRSEDSTGAGWGQELYFNTTGQRAALTGERKSDVEARIARQNGPASDDDRSAIASGADALMLVQVPLVHAQRRRTTIVAPAQGAYEYGLPAIGSPKDSAAAPASRGASESARSDIERAVLGHGPTLGPMVEANGLRLVRDERFPIRVTVQFYKASSNGIVSDEDLDDIARTLKSVYDHGDAVGSLVVPAEDRPRATSWTSSK
jgi:hypothetical protein